MTGMLSMRNLIRIIFIAVCLFIPASVLGYDSSESGSQVWKVGQRRWTIEEENKYSKWVAENIKEDFFVRHKIPVDCADVVYAIRWIYARIAHLPAAATTIDNQLIGHWSTDWGNLPTDKTWHKDKRFRAALMYMLSKSSTRSLPDDTYPILISADSVKPGTIFFIGEAHAGLVQNVIMDGSSAHPVQTFEATMPPRIQKMSLKNFVSSNPESSFQSGLVRFRWLTKKNNRWQYISIKTHPYYSEEQYSSDFNSGYADYLESVAKRIDPTVYDPYEKINKLLDVLNRQLKARIPVVLKSNDKCYKKKCPEGSYLWDLYSTPGRDEYICVMISHIKEIIKKNQINQEDILDKMALISLQISPDRFITLDEVFRNASWMSSDPEDSIEARWGLDKCGIIEKRIKNVQDTIAFIRKNYEKTNPQFAQKSILTRQIILDEMLEEKQESNCEMSKIKNNEQERIMCHGIY
jgi:hypothetical protein